MCPLEKGRLTSCQITYFPIDSQDYIGEINKVLDIIQSYPVEFHIGILSTTIRGDHKTIFQLIEEIYDTMTGEKCNFTISFMISNICGCQI